MVEVDESVGGPELPAQFFAGDDVATAAKEQDKDVERAAAQLQRATLLSHLARAFVDLEKTEAINRSRRRCLRRHRLPLMPVDSSRAEIG
ncbi:MAG TPA: hypothetical protein VKE96_14705 [Vicinamibacterales bacterium]|nr:hypothetical protein [Vicinamibacterales bacterium]